EESDRLSRPAPRAADDAPVLACYGFAVRTRQTPVPRLRAQGLAQTLRVYPQHFTQVLEAEYVPLIARVEPSLELGQLDALGDCGGVEVSQVAMNRVRQHCDHQPGLAVERPGPFVGSIELCREQAAVVEAGLRGHIVNS